jgi:hypothetical protein
MKNFEYYGLFLTEESKTKLKAWLWENGYDFNNDIIKGTLPENWYLDHCTLLHWSQSDYIKEAILEDRLDERYSIIIDGIGASDKSLAFRVTGGSMCTVCANKIPHITICTFNGGKPVDSNNITEWKDIEPIIVEAKLEKK